MVVPLMYAANLEPMLRLGDYSKISHGSLIGSWACLQFASTNWSANS